MTFAAGRAAADPPPPATAPATPATPATTPPAASPPATPRKVTQADRDAARTLAEQGFEKFQQRRYDEAIALFSRAEERFHAPTHVAYIARSHEKRGELLEAAALYRKLLAETLPRDAPQPFRDAQSEAGPALEAILRRTPRLRVDVTGPAAAQATITAADRTLPPATPTPWDPGTVLVRVTAPDLAPLERTVVLPERAADVAVRFELARPRSLLGPLGALVVGLGGTATALATGFAGRAMQADALRICSDQIVCSDTSLDAQKRQLAEAKQLEGTAIGAGIAGGVFLAAAVTLFVLRPTSKSTVEPASAASPTAGLVRPTFVLRAGPAFTGVSGTF